MSTQFVTANHDKIQWVPGYSWGRRSQGVALTTHPYLSLS